MIYKFVEHPMDREKLDKMEVVILHNKIEKDGYKSLSSEERKRLDIKFSELWHPTTYQYGIYNVGGWKIVFPHLKLYWVDIKYYGILKRRAYNKGMIRRNATTPSRIQKIVEIDI